MQVPLSTSCDSFLSANGWTTAATGANTICMTTPILSFGIISDTQYADADDAYDFHQIQKRHYRHALDVARTASAHFVDRNVGFVLQVGDILDGKNGEKNRDSALQAMRDALQMHRLTCHNCVGNHELYLWTRSELRQTGLMSDPSKQQWFYAFDAHETLRVIMLDSFCESILDRDDHAGKQKSLEFLRARNPNDVTSNVDWTKGLTGLNRRFLPYNGAFGDAQLEWLRGELRASKSRRQRAIVCTHVPIGVGSCQDVTLNWDFDACIAVLHDKEFRCAHDETRSLVVAVLAGHDHDGGSIVDEAGILHKTLVSPLICKPSETAFVRAELYADRLELIGIGIEKSHTIPL